MIRLDHIEVIRHVPFAVHVVGRGRQTRHGFNVLVVAERDRSVEEIDWDERDPLSRRRRPRKVDEAIAAALGQLSATA